MNHQSLPLWGVDVFAHQPLAGVRAFVVGAATSTTSTQHDRILETLTGMPVGIVDDTGDAVELVATGGVDGHPEQLALAALAVTDHTPSTVVSPGGQYAVPTTDPEPTLAVEPPAATIDQIDATLDEPLAGVSRGTLTVGDAELPPAAVTLGRRWLVVPLAYFSELSGLETAAAISRPDSSEK